MEARSDFPIVGIGASAGGLEALEQLLHSVPENSGMAFVVVQHLDPTQKGMMPELLQRMTPMKVMQVKERTLAQPNHVYVIPPNKDMSLLHGKLHLLDPTLPRGLRLPIDCFFRSLAVDQREHGIGIILSGMGTDGTLGVRAIREADGLVLVQDPATAKFDGMPRSAVDTRMADIIAPANELVGRLLSYLQRRPAGTARSETLEDNAKSSGLEKIMLLLRAHTGHDFSLYKKSTLYRRIERRMGIHQIQHLDVYVRFLQENLPERELLFKELLIGVTSFFRDPAAWKQLKEQVFPDMFRRYPDGAQLRAWAVGCSTGEEAFSLAMTFKETIEATQPPAHFTLQVFATDLDEEAINRARQGLYPLNIAADVSPERLSRFFTKEDGGYRVSKDIREMVVLAPQNLIQDPPFTKLDLLVCRNLLIYLSPELQKKVMPLFYYALNPEGVLFLGTAESCSGFNDLFTPLEGKWRLFRRRDTGPQELPTSFPVSTRLPTPARSATPSPTGQTPNLQTLADQLMMQRFSRPAVMVNSRGDIHYVYGRTGDFLEAPVGKANWNLLAMAREGLRQGVAAAFRKAVRERTSTTARGLRVEGHRGKIPVDVTIQTIEEPEALRGMLTAVFTETPASPGPKAGARAAGTGKAHMAELEQELELLRNELQSIRDEMQTSQEELKSANEELQSTNEELQSTNEELTTSKEEMQSLNEELQTVNAELQNKLDELSRANNDMKNLLNSTDIATVFLDGMLNIRRFTTQATKLIKLIPGDVGRPVTDIASALLYPGLSDDVQEVLRTLVFVERQVQSREDKWFSIRIMPYRTIDNVIDGVVITFTDITAFKNLELELRRVRSEKEIADSAERQRARDAQA